jgi:hypothetical protein
MTHRGAALPIPSRIKASEQGLAGATTIPNPLSSLSTSSSEAISSNLNNQALSSRRDTPSSELNEDGAGATLVSMREVQHGRSSSSGKAEKSSTQASSSTVNTSKVNVRETDKIPPRDVASTQTQSKSASSQQRAFGGIAQLQASSTTSVAAAARANSLVVNNSTSGNSSSSSKKKNKKNHNNTVGSNSAAAVSGPPTSDQHPEANNLMVLTGEESLLLTEGGEGLQGIVLTDELSFL